MSATKKLFAMVFTLIAINVAVSVFGAVFASAPEESHTIYSGVNINNIDVGGLTKDQARYKLTRVMEPGLRDSKLILSYKDFKLETDYIKLGAVPNYDKAVEAAFDLGRESNPLVRAFNTFKLRRQKVDIPLTWTLEEKKVNSVLQKIAQEINKPAKEARVVFENNQIRLLPEKDGYELLISETIKAIENVLDQHPTEVEMVVKKSNPKLKASQLAGIQDDIAVAVTTFDKEDENRKDNIKLASDYLNNTLVEAGETFSFNEITGLRSKDRGFKEAAVINNEKLVNGVGGGVCQVSTTLYRAVLLGGGFEILERNPHSLPVEYVPIGQDAAVADNQLDFKFENKRENPVLITSYIENDKIIVRILGKKENDNIVELVSNTVKTIEPKVVVKKDKDLYKGITKIVDPGQKGYTVKVYRVSTDKAGNSERELVSTSYYSPQDKIVRVGTKENKKARVNK